ncbi:hypothetical protein H0H92_014278, partial [Tricholoma furcatifolium]
GAIALATTEERDLAYLNATNDDNEGALGTLRIRSRHAPNMTLHQHKARTMYKPNGTGKYIRLIQHYKTKAPLLAQDRVAVAAVEAEKALDTSGYDSDLDIDFNR